jgi:hypothetical protein
MELQKLEASSASKVAFPIKIFLPGWLSGAAAEVAWEWLV